MAPWTDDFDVPVSWDNCLKDFHEDAAHCAPLPPNKEPVQNLFSS